MEYVGCNLCGAGDTRVIYPWGKSNVVICRKCGLIYKNPRRSRKAEMFEYDIDEHWKDREVFLDSKKEMFNEQLRKIEKLIGKGKLLDVGFGYGDFMKIAYEMGWAVEGVEVLSQCCKFAKDVLGLNVFEGTLTQANFPSDYFDAVTMWDSLDFMYDPFGELSEVRRGLKPHGVLLVRIRNAKFHIPFKYLFRNSQAIVHLYSFVPKTIKLMLEKAGFEEIRIMNSKLTGNVPMLWFLNSIISCLNWVRADHMVFAPSLLVYARG